MIQSMTGYGKAETTIGTGKITVEIKSLNGKNADISIKSQLLPKDKEISVRQMIAQKLQRGNIDFFITYEADAAETAKEINSGLVMSYFRQIMDINGMIEKEFPGKGNVDAARILGSVMRFPDIIDQSKKQDIINDDNWEKVRDCIAEALERICEYRTEEGKSLYADVTSKVKNILGYIPLIEEHEKERTEAVRERIVARLAEIGASPDSNRLEQEMIYYLEKLDINEEKVRLRQHCKYFMETIENEPCPGRKLGFIAQEMGREINTTGSKANHSDIQKIVVKMKDELEKIKEQTLNIL
ncbi:MAG: YicC family protein [Bacteroidetes bacterium]|uniref:YicC family protein n=1 Tax=Candidatus Cryptobacteroides merdigallinarum TaxID=2840770 RepID=A0A9D9EKR8_9BACT|nr:YicC family protein [Candidatus Cryptobacteroides merdigallinarum]